MGGASRQRGHHGRSTRTGRADHRASGQILYTREESLRVHPSATHHHSRAHRARVRHAHRGRSRAVRDSGAYASLGEKVMTRATTHATGPMPCPTPDRLLRHVHQQRSMRRVAASVSPVGLCGREQHDILAANCAWTGRAAAQERAARCSPLPPAVVARKCGLPECLTGSTQPFA